MNRPITDEALQLIKHFEGFSAEPYYCEAGKCTIGIGTTRYPNGKEVNIHDPKITLEKALEYLAFELATKANIINAFLKQKSVLLNDQQYSVLVSFAYNAGCDWIVSPGHSLHDAICNDNVIEIANSLLLYNKITKKVLGFPIKKELTGLTRRRKSERYLFLNGKNFFFEK